jgi:hypothetical protein
MARQYNLKDFNGLHLKAPYDYDSYNADGVNALIENFDFFPLKSADVTDFSFINSSINLVDSDSTYYGKIMGDGFRGDNLFTNRTHDLPYSQIRKTNELVKGEKYYTNFNFYFNFGGEDASGFQIGSTGYTISVTLYAILGNTKRKLKLSDLRVYNYKSATYSGSTSNPVDAGYVPLSTAGYSLYNSYVELDTDNINASFLPRPRRYNVINNSAGIIYYSYIEGDSSSVNYGDAVSTSVPDMSSGITIISFAPPEIQGLVLASEYQIIDSGFDMSEVAPFDVMNGGPLFRVTAQLDTTSKAEFDANICKGNKDFKLMVDYNGTVSKTIITYVQEEISVDIPTLPVYFS